MESNTLVVKQLAELSNEELDTLWFHCDHLMDNESLELVYCERSKRGMKS